MPGADAEVSGPSRGRRTRRGGGTGDRAGPERPVPHRSRTQGWWCTARTRVADPWGKAWRIGAGYGIRVQDEPLDPFAGDPVDPTSALDDDFAEPSGQTDPLSAEERQDVLDDLTDLDVYETLLSDRGIRGLVVDCEDCRIPHYFAWDLLRSNLRHLLEVGRTRVHEPAFDPDPTDYVTWEYARGYADGTQDALEDEDPDEPA